MTLRLITGRQRGLTARMNLIAMGMAAIVLVLGCAYLWVMFQSAKHQSEAQNIFTYREVVLELRDSFQRLQLESARGAAASDVRSDRIDGWLWKLSEARKALPPGESDSERTRELALERALRAMAANHGPAEAQAVNTELDVVSDQAREAAVEHQRTVDDFLLRASLFGGALVALLLLGMFVGAPAWTRREIAAPLTGICNELERTSKETAHCGAQLDVSANRVLAASTIQAEAIQETVAAMNEITAMVAQTTHRAGSSASEARAVLEKTRAGKAVVLEMNEAMQSLTQANEKLERISKIFKQISHKTTVINDIAFKTKMLSINAAVEAARAGQHGRGFSVVASEVGNLSKLSADAANAVRALLADSQQEVSDIIETTSEQVRAGSRVTSAVDQVFSEIAKAVQQVAEQAVAISQAANEQELGVKQTASGIEQIHSKMLETRGAAENTRVELRVVNEQASKLVSLSADLRQVLQGSKVSGEDYLADRRNVSSESLERAPATATFDDDEAAALVRRLGEAAREGRGHTGATPANDNIGRARGAG
jgi:Methyl-accepting chemotaxis protein (MCP) signalling domain